MVRSVEQIEQDLVALDQAVQAIAQELQSVYRQYLTSLGQSLNKQLVLAAYHICTQGYPDRFLNLSLSQRQDLQQALRQLARQTQAQLDTLLDGQASTLLPVVGVSLTEWVRAMMLRDSDEPVDKWSSTASDQPIVEDALDPEGDYQPDDITDMEAPAVDTPPVTTQLPTPLTPKALESWLEHLDTQVVEQLQMASHAANHLLQQANILPHQVPEPILDVAAKAGADTIGTPNLLSILVETDPEDKENAKVTHIMAIRLKLVELEFNDALLTSLRTKLRQLTARLNQISKDHQKKQREKAIAQAEAAWRACWYEQ